MYKKIYVFDINLQCIIQCKEGHIRPKGIQSSYFLYFVNCLRGGRIWSLNLLIRRVIKWIVVIIEA